jgi:hypothetical protein
MKNKTFNECLAEGLLIFNKYCKSGARNLRASCEAIYCYPDNGVISEQDQLILVELGWHNITEKEEWDYFCGWWQYSI